MITVTEELEQFYDAYVECALWTEDIPFALDLELAEMKQDCIDFLVKAGHLMTGLDFSQCGHDFWLTRNGHGTGFWDRDLENSLADKLTDLSNQFGEYNISVNIPYIERKNETMNKYKVYLREERIFSVEVEAENEEIAGEQAHADHYYWKQHETSSEIEITEIMKI